MPLCPQITITPITVTSTGMVETSVIAAADPATTEQLATTSASAAAAAAAAAAANATAVAAQAAAAAAQASAATAFATAVAANTAASTAQTTADGKNKVTYSTAAPGSTSNAVGDIWFQYGTVSPNVGRVIAQYIGAGTTNWTQTTVSGLVIANIDAASITTGTLSVAVGITGTLGNFTVDAVTGALFANSATIRGAIQADSGYFGSSTNGFSVNATGLVGVGSGLIVGGTIQTSTGTAAIILNGSSNALQFKASGSIVANMVPLVTSAGAFGLLMHYGATPDPTGGTRPQMFIGSGSVSLSADTSNVVSVATTGISVGGSVLVSSSGVATLANQTNYTGIASGSGSTVVVVTTGSRLAFVPSTRKSKSNIETLTGTFVDKLLALEAVSFDWKDQPADMPYRRNYGFIAEDVASLPSEIESIVNYNVEDEPVSISYDRLCTFLVLAIQELKAEINTLKGE